MLFNSFVFIFLFLPIAFAGFFSLGRFAPRLAAAWLTTASLFFYGWWNPIYVPLLLWSILFNYSCARFIAHAAGPARAQPRTYLLTLAITGNLLLLGYYKYANFFLDSAGTPRWARTGACGDIILPLGISFFTFTQIAFLVDTLSWRGPRVQPRRTTGSSSPTSHI